jgi:hypothetical protein
MAETHVISALVAKRGELSGELIAAEKRIVQIRADLASIDGVIRVFDPSIASANNRPIVKRKTPLSLPQGQGARLILDMLRRAGEPLSPRQIAERVASERALSVDGKAMERLTQRIRNTLARHDGRGVMCEMVGNGKVWRID